MDPLTFLSRLAALIPRPRAHMLTYHGILAGRASYRDRVVPVPPGSASDEGVASCDHVGSPCDPERVASGRPRRSRSKYYTWAELMKRVFAIDVLVCDRCGGPRKVLKFLTDPVVIRRILVHLGLPTEAPRLAKARAPPRMGLPFAD